MAATNGHFSGAYEALWMARDTNGYPKGNSATPDSVSNGTTLHAVRLPGLVTATSPSATRNSVTWRGGMKTRGKRQTGLEDFGAFNLTLAGFDESFDALVTGSVADATTGGSDNVITAPNSNLAAYPQGILILTRGFQGADGTNRFMSWCYNNVTLEPQDPEFNQSSGVNPQPMTYLVTPSQSPRTALGFLLSSLTVAVEDSNDYYIRYRTNERIHVTTYIDDGSATSFVLGYRPVSGEHAGATNVFTKNGASAHASVSDLSTTTGATTHTAGTAADIWVCVYGTRFVAI